MPKDNYIKLNELFATYFSKQLDSIGSLYFTKEVFDGTYPGYGSSYRSSGRSRFTFEQASSRGLKQKTAYGYVNFPFTIRNQFVSSLATVQAAVENQNTLRISGTSLRVLWVEVPRVKLKLILLKTGSK